MPKGKVSCQAGRGRFNIKGSEVRLPDCFLPPDFEVELEDGQTMKLCSSHLMRLRRLGLKNKVRVIDTRPGHKPKKFSRCGPYMRHSWNQETGKCQREGCGAQRNPAMRYFGLGIGPNPKSIDDPQTDEIAAAGASA